MLIAVYGGSFNPPHRAHALVASWLLSEGLVDAVWLVPVFEHAFEGIHAKRLASFTQRVQWCTAMAKDIGPDVTVSTVESTLASPSYTIDTLMHLCAAHPEHSFRLVVGADILEQVEGWKQWDAIVENFAPVVVGRDGYPAQEGVPSFPAVSSTEIRSRMTEGKSAEELVSPGVWALLRGTSPWV